MLSLDYYGLSLLLLSILTGISCEELTPVKNEEFSLEGSTVTLSYTYSKAATYTDYFFWYRQYPGKPPEFLILHLGTQNAKKCGLSVKVSEDKTRMDLQISSAAVTDSAVYYCAVRPTVTANPQSLVKIRTILDLELECKGEERVIQPTGHVIATDGDTVTLGCTFDNSDPGPTLFWYKQDGDNSPKFILSRFKLDQGNTPDEFKERFSSTLDSTLKSVPLKIQKLQLSDSAVRSKTVTQVQKIKTFTVVFHTKTRQILFIFKMLSVNFSLFVTLFLLTIRGVSCEELTPDNDEESSLEGSTVTLSYKYSKQATALDYFFWYRQYPGKPPEFLISHSGKGTLLKNLIPRLQIKVEQNQINLQISSAAVTDSAVYYCAVKPTVTGNIKTLYKNLWSKENTPQRPLEGVTHC
ncbi:uncharacterized protein LOC122886671 [Siniperca chuatsi]|uniref:uncharacterized protein LOC122886671 n=1 Tax=Siniperca chuatsi TaxID=119488 RepID=UPI001CE1C119|nr:uncharacterized protein LOC122886671 [Siniperca chuatsi]